MVGEPVQDSGRQACAGQPENTVGVSNPPAANEVLLEGRLLGPVEYRVTPGGRAVASFELEHLSCHAQPDSGLRLEMRLPVMALGALAERCRVFSPGCLLRVTGRLNQKRWIRDGQVRWGRVELFALGICGLDGQH